jgi:hypothetical protein
MIIALVLHPIATISLDLPAHIDVSCTIRVAILPNAT